MNRVTKLVSRDPFGTFPLRAGSATTFPGYLLCYFKAPASGNLTDLEILFEGSGGGTRTNICKCEIFAVDTAHWITGSAIAWDAAFTAATQGTALSTLDNFASGGVCPLVADTWYCAKITTTAADAFNNYGVLAAGTIGGCKPLDTFTFSTTDGSLFLCNGSGVPLNLKIGGSWYGSYTSRVVLNNLTSQLLYNTSGSRIARFGIMFTPAYDVALTGITVPIYRTGTISGYLTAEIYSGTTLLYTSMATSAIDGYSTNASSPSTVWLDMPRDLMTTGTTYRIVVRISGSGTAGDASNYLALKGFASMSNFPSDDSKILDGFYGGCFCTEVTPSTWTDYRASGNAMPSIGLYGEIVPSVGGGGLLVGPSVLVS